VNARGAIGLALLTMDDPNPGGQIPVRLLSKTFRTMEPGVIAAAGDIENIAHPAYSVNLPVIRYEMIFHF